MKHQIVDRMPMGMCRARARRYASLIPTLSLWCAIAEAQARSESFIRITVEPTRPQLAVGPGFGVVAEIENVSSSAVVYLWEQNTVLVVPPEVWDPSKRSGWDSTRAEPWQALWGFFPSDVRPEGGSTCIALRPGDSYNVYWDTRAEQQPLSLVPYLFKQVKSELYFMFFSPGLYKLGVIVEYWSGESRDVQTSVCSRQTLIDSTKLTDSRTASESVTLSVAAPQSVILFGAGIGGLIAYGIIPTSRRRSRRSSLKAISARVELLRRATKEAIGVVGAILLSVIVTILLSRISETQFFVRVTVADLWGAIAVGFLANYAGVRVLDRILGSPKTREDEPPRHPEAGADPIAEPDADPKPGTGPADPKRTTPRRDDTAQLNQGGSSGGSGE